MEFEEENPENMSHLSINHGVISESDLLDIYENQYNDLFPKILKISEENFFAILQEQVLLNLRIINKLSDLSLMSFFQELLLERYKQDKEKAENDFNIIQKLKENEITFLDYNSCYIHCFNNFDLRHNCGNKLIYYKDFIYCINCQKVYNEKQIKLYCNICNVNYISKLRNNDLIDKNEDDEAILYPAAFDEIHEECKKENELENDQQIKCFECGSELYFNLAEKDENFLVCSKCKLMFDIRKVKFKCPFCGKDFLTKAKLYNDVSNKKIEVLFLIHSLRKEKLAFPQNLENKKCKCDFKEIKEFKHKDDNGNLLEGKFFGNKKIICGQCFEIWDREKYLWTCPICGDIFIEELNTKNNIELKNEIKIDEIKEDKENKINKEKLEKEEIKQNIIKEEEKGEVNITDIYDENFEDYEETTEEIKKINENNKEIDKKNEINKNDNLEINEYKKGENFIENINNNKNNEIKENVGLKLRNSPTKSYNIIENNKTIKIDLPPQINLKNEAKNKITEVNKIKDKKFYINNQYYISNKVNTNDKGKNESPKNTSSKIIINRRNTNNVVESKYSSNSSNQKIIQNNLQNRLENINNRQKNKNNFNKINHQIKNIIGTNKNLNVNIKRNNKTNEEIKIVMNNNNKENEKNKKEFKNLVKYFDDFNEEFEKELKINEQKRKKQLDNNKNKNIELKIGLNNNKNQNQNNIVHNIKHTSNISNNIDKYSNKNIQNNNNILLNDIDKNNKNKIKKNLSSNKLDISKNKKNVINNIKYEITNTNKEQPIQKNNNTENSNTYKTITSVNSKNYKNIKVLGQGSYGKIYLVEDINTKEQFAMKKLILGDQLELKDNQNEFNMIMQITSSYPEINIVHVYGTETKNFDEYNFVFYVLMELANCDWEKELRNRAKHKAYYTEEELIYILQSLVDTFSYLQQIGICHRDIKPQNILCFGENGYKISDFGEAKFRRKWRYKQDMEGYTSNQTVRGTELYMSPILYKALKTAPNKGVNHNVFKSDVFSLGMCFLFALCLDYQCLYDMRKVKNMNDVKGVVYKYADNRYSNYFLDTLIIMLDLNEKERPDFIEFGNMI